MTGLVTAEHILRTECGCHRLVEPGGVQALREALSKAALLAAAVRYADGVEPLPEMAALPESTPAAGELAGLVADRLGHEVAESRLVKALAGRRGVAIVDELTEFVTDLYGRLARHRVGINLVDRCSPELPELGQVWFGWAELGRSRR